MRVLFLISLLSMGASFVSPIFAAEQLRFGNSKNGEKLHQQHCIKCHDSKVYTRPDRKINSYENLQHRVGMCASQLNIAISLEQQQDISRYLAQRFYKF
ncbi:MAG: hypothetical protein IME93_01245 [Proteobacteria bacterium]|nr:hypothetical protein [Pseudomonadota bacterium]